MRETVSGVLHASVVPKRRGTLLDQLFVSMFVESGRITLDDRRFFYAPEYYLTTERADQDNLLWSFKGQPRALSIELRGHEVTVRATIEQRALHRLAILVRPQILAVSEGRIEGHRCDSPRACGGVKADA